MLYEEEKNDSRSSKIQERIGNKMRVNKQADNGGTTYALRTPSHISGAMIARNQTQTQFANPILPTPTFN